MNEFKKLFKIAGFIEIGAGVLIYESSIISSIIVILGIIMFYISSLPDENILKNKDKYFLFALLILITNPISGIILIVANGKINDYEKSVNSINSPPKKKIIVKKKPVDPEIKKIDILLKLGVGMVFISGILFATTSWDFISDLSKAIALVVLGTLFLALSKFSENKLKLYNTTYMYWILGMSFYLLTIVGMLYFGIIGTNLTYTGYYSNIAYAITFFTVAGLALATYLKFSQKAMLYVIYTAVLLMFVNILLSLNIQLIIICLIITIASLMINILIKENTSLSKFNTFVAFLLIVHLTGAYIKANEILVLITSIFMVINVSYLSIKKKEETLSIISLALSYYLIILSICNLKIDNNIECMLLVTASTIYTLLLKLKIVKSSDSYEKINYIIYSILSLGISLLTTSIYPIIISAIYLAVNYIVKQDINNSQSIKIAKYIEPFAIFMLFTSINNYSSILKASSMYVITTLIFVFIRIFNKDEKTEKVYNIATYIGIFISYIMIEDDYDFLTPFAIIIPCAYQFFKSLEKEEKIPHIILYILTLTSIYNAIYVLDLFDIGNIISSIIFIWIVVLVICLIKHEHIKKASFFVLVIPIYNIMNALDTNITLSIIMSSLLTLYITFLIARFLCSEEKTKEVIAIIGISIATLLTAESTSLMIGLYVGIVGIVTAIIGYYRKNSKGLFITGIVITILNIIYQLKEFWGQVPIWLYLLVGGLGLIFFVTYREVKKLNKK